MSKNKVSQELRRKVRAYVQDQFTIINDVVRPRPKYVPLWLWAWGARIFIDTALLRKYLEEGVEPKAVRQSTEKPE